MVNQAQFIKILPRGKNLSALYAIAPHPAKPVELNMENWEYLYNLLRLGQVHSMHELLENESIREYRDHNNNNLLLIAAHSCNEIVIRQMVNAGLQINETNFFGDSPLMLAALSNSRIVKALLELGADVHIRSWDGFTALHLAAINGDVGVVKDLLDAGASLNLLDDSGRTALHMAVNFSSIEVARLLIERGIEVDLHKDANTALSLAVRNGDDKMVRLLLDAGATDMSYHSNTGRTLLHDSMYMQKEEIIRDLITRGANVNAVDADGFSPLHEAVLCRNVPQILLLLDNGAKITTKTTEGNTPLHWAIIGKTSEIPQDIIKILLDKGANINEPNADGSTPFHFILRNGNIEDIQLFLSYNTDIVMQNYYGENILHWAAANEDPKVMKLLLNCNLPIDGVCAHGLTALHIAAKSGRSSTIYDLVKKGANINVTDIHKRTPIYFAAVNGQKLAVKLLLDLGADINRGTHAREMIMYVALKRKSRIITNLIIQHLANLEAKGRTINAHNIALIDRKDELRNHFENCRLELQKMKDCKVYNSVSHFRVLNSSTNVIAGLARNDDIRKCFENNSYGSEYSIYKLALKNKVQKGIERCKFLTSMGKLLSEALPFRDPDHVIIRTILQYLHKDDVPGLCS